MRIGNIIIDTDNMTANEIDVLIKELRAVRARKHKAEELNARMAELLREAEENQFDFIDKDLGFCVRFDELKLIDSHT